MSQYETIFICKPDLPSDKVASLTEKVKSIITESTGTINAVNEWGKRRLAYPISGCQEGIYVFFDFTAPSEAVNKVETFYKITEEIIRFISVRKESRMKKKPLRKPKDSLRAIKKEDSRNAPENKVARTE
ncbi:MAG: 30S ribosomal protein S6 [Elusimicrobia bacterium]|nr:30S ribosomal protein S6 [Elusimicrobiota bacterium]MBU2615021.1 30S ribosomal protein S6 [Elusimicrobiota bacterium]